jgi:hypothetical protein
MYYWRKDLYYAELVELKTKKGQFHAKTTAENTTTTTTTKTNKHGTVRIKLSYR